MELTLRAECWKQFLRSWQKRYVPIPLTPNAFLTRQEKRLFKKPNYMISRRKQCVEFCKNFDHSYSSYLSIFLCCRTLEGQCFCLDPEWTPSTP